MRRCIKFKLRLRPKLYQLEIAFDNLAAAALMRLQIGSDL